MLHPVVNRSISPWISLQPLTAGFCRASNLVKINKEEFVTIPNPPYYSYTDAHHREDKHDGYIYKYNIRSMTWSISMKTPDYYNPMYHRICSNDKSQTIYSSGTNYKMAIIDINRERVQTFFNLSDNKSIQVPDSSDIGSIPSLIMIESECHVIGGQKSNKHLVWDNKQNTFQLIHSFHGVAQGFVGAALIYLKSKQKILCIGGKIVENISAQTGFKTDKILEYSLKNKQWSDGVILPEPMNFFGYVVTRDDRFVIFLGIIAQKLWSYIYVLDLKTFNMIRTDIALPEKYELFHAVLMPNKWRDIVIVTGFVRLLNVKSVPNDILQLINEWYSTDNIHIISESSSKHWKINIGHIL